MGGCDLTDKGDNGVSCCFVAVQRVLACADRLEEEENEHSASRDQEQRSSADAVAEYTTADGKK